MLASRIDAILCSANAAAGAGAELPGHIRSLAATIERMAATMAADPAPTRTDVFTLEQAARILYRWVADHRGSAIEQANGATAFTRPPELPAL